MTAALAVCSLSPAVGLASGTSGATGPADQGAVAVAPEKPIPLGPIYRVFGGFAVGKGVRFNDPYRLQTELGRSAQSLSLAATYLDVRLGATLGKGRVVSHGVALHGSFALEGIPQEVVTPSYVVFVEPTPRWALVGRAGIPFVVEPDLNAGFELSAGGLLHLTAALGVTADVVGSLFYGAATLEAPRTAIPILSLEAGVLYDYEVLP